MKKLLLLMALALLVVTLMMLPLGCGEEKKAETGNAGTTASGKTILTPEQLTEIAPGLGVLMIEVGYRNWVMYYAADGGNWDLAAYQMKELKEAQEVAETTRPKRADALKSFETSALGPLDEAIKAKDKAKFMAAWTKEVEGCNGCHASQGFTYIKWTLPPTPPEDLVLTP